MQYHGNGFRPGDPHKKNAATDAGSKHSDVDVIIVGCGPAGLTMAAQLSAFADVRTRILERKTGPLRYGQADGIACRSMEMFEAFGFADKVAKEAYWVNETTFWRPGDDGQILTRADRIQDVEDGLSEFPHTILSQARIHDFFLETMENSPRRLHPDYARELVDISIDEKDDYPVRAAFKILDEDSPAAMQFVNSRYLVGCDGARSTVRRLMGRELKGESARQLWGVMDILAVTDFPDIRLKSAIQSASEGSLLIIPREGGYLVRMYMELDELRDGERAADRNVTPDMLIEKATKILAPHKLEVKEVAWWSAYEIGQRLCDCFDDVDVNERGSRHPRIFIAGDACHTHSPKAGQGMNVSMADAFNLGWKLAAVVRGLANPDLLYTYSDERKAKAHELIEFDKDMARLFSSGNKAGRQSARFQQYFARHARYTAGVETRYSSSLICGPQIHQKLAGGFEIGTRFHSSPVIRLADAKQVHLGHLVKADGRWRVFAFADAGDHGQTGGKISTLCDFLANDPDSPLLRHTRLEDEIDSVIDFRAVFQQFHRDLRLDQMPQLLRPF